MKMNKELIGC